ncbi:MAG: cupin domain-containing protein [Lachnospiraceae bacterium]|nr:cupin domain-containing protein [Lachnospiraceae bacterium]
MNIILLSGGSGKRLWPLSNNVRAKQFLKVLRAPDGSHESMIQRMTRMIANVYKDANIVIVTADSQVNTLQRQVGSDIEICVEPSRKKTFPATALACAYLKDKKGIDEKEAVVVCPVDTFTENEYFTMFKTLSESLEDVNLALIGIEPTYPSEKYGYIIPKDRNDVSIVSSFKEKPDEDTARKYIEQGALWNGGVFAFKLSYMLGKVEKYLSSSSYDYLYDNYESLSRMSFDHEVVEREDSIKVFRYSGAWKDLGTWNTLTEAMEDEASGNAKLINCENTHVLNELQLPLIAMGLKNVAVAATPDGILVSDKHESSYLKPYVDDKRPMVEKRAWGEYEVLDYRGVEGRNALTKHLLIFSGHHISYQKHYHRSETWTIIEGEGYVILDGKKKRVSRDDTIVIPVGVKHGIMAVKDIHIIEVQVGDELTEEDIERFDWDWTME